MELKIIESEKSRNALIIGNGISRKNYDLTKLNDKYTIFACNAYYRDNPYDSFDYLVSIDEAISKEIKDSDVPRVKIIHPPLEDQFELPNYNKIYGTRYRSNAGMNAMLEAIKRKFKTLYIVGFDFLIKGDLALSNMYDGSNCYGPETRANATDNLNRVQYFKWFVQNHLVEYKICYPRIKDLEIFSIPGENVSGMFIDQLKG